MSNWTERTNSSAARIERAALDLVSEVNALADMTADTLSDSIESIDRCLNPDEYSLWKGEIDPQELLAQIREDLSALLRRYDSAAIGAIPRITNLDNPQPNKDQQ